MITFSDPYVASLPIITFITVLTLMPRGIKWLKKLNFGQHVRDDGPETHKSKKGTPTMGGVIFIPIAVVFSVMFAFFIDHTAGMYALVIGVFVHAGLAVGWLDDYRSIKKGKSLGLKAREKLVLQFIIVFVFLVVLRELHPFLGGYPSASAVELWSKGWAYLIFLSLICVWLINAANIADGLDGLAASQAIVALAAIVMTSSVFRVFLPGLSEAPLVMIGALLAFLCYNAPPARVFMGDAGSIALGCFIVGYGLVLVPLWILFLATAVWTLEALSVVIQVIYFKLTGGRRIFRMSPIHHHFELCGWPETQVTSRFIVASVVLGILVPMVVLSL